MPCSGRHHDYENLSRFIPNLATFPACSWRRGARVGLEQVRFARSLAVCAQGSR